MQRHLKLLSHLKTEYPYLTRIVVCSLLNSYLRPKLPPSWKSWPKVGLNLAEQCEISGQCRRCVRRIQDYCTAFHFMLKLSITKKNNK